MQAFLRTGLPALTALAAVVAIGLTAAYGAAIGLVAWIVAATLGCGAIIARDTRLGVLATAVGCGAANAYLLSQKLNAAAGPSICTVSTYLDCDKVNTSVYSEALGVPVTLFGLAFYAGLALAAVTASKSDTRFDQVNTLFAIVSCAYSVYLGAAAISLGAFCVMCASIYGGNVLLLAAGVKGLREGGWQLGHDLGGVPVSRSFLTISAVFVVGVIGFQGRGASPGPRPAPVPVPGGTAPSTDVSHLVAEPRGPVELDGTEPILGDPDAPYLVVEWADFGCGHCAHAAPQLHELVERRPDVQVRFKSFALSPMCNPVLEGQDTGERCLAAAAADCARQQGKFWEYAHELFTHPQSFAMPALTYHAEGLGLDLPAFEACIVSPATAQGVSDDIAAGIRAGVQGTPALYLSGRGGSDRFVQILYSPEELLLVLEADEAARKPGPSAGVPPGAQPAPAPPP